MATCTRVFATAANNADIGNVAWGTTGNVFVSDDARATVSLSVAGYISQYLHVTNSSHSSGTALAAADTITQIVFKVEKSKAGNPSASVVDNQVHPIHSGSRIALDLALGGAWSTSDTLTDYTQTTSLPSGSVVLASDWGLAFACNNSNSTGGATGQLDVVYADITFTPAPVTSLTPPRRPSRNFKRSW